MTSAHERLRRVALVIFCIVASAIPAFPQLETRSSSPIVYEPYSIAVADFNHDGKLDVAVAAWYTGQVAVLLGRGDGTFQPAVYYNVDSQIESVYAVVAADFNHDGNVDLAVADFLGSNISVLLGNGDGTFRPPTRFPTTSTASYLAVGDFNNDGNLDLVMCDSPYVSVLLGNGDGTFRAPLDFDVSLCSGASGQVLATGDFNRDGRLDVAVVSYNVVMLLGNGDGTFQMGAQYYAGEFSQSLTAGEFTEDHNVDLAVTNGSGNQIYIFLGNGDGTFQSEPPFAVDEPAAIIAADVNGDGKTDLVFSSNVPPSFNVTTAAVMLGNGDGTFQPATEYGKFDEAAFVAVGDFNGDHQPDLVVANYLGESVVTLLNTGVASFSSSTPLTFPAQLIGTTSPPKNVALTNTGSTALTISSISVTPPFHLGSGTTCGSSVAAGGNCTLSVVFQPTLKSTANGLLTISDSASSRPQVIELTGAGTVISFAPREINFGSQKVGTKSATQIITVTNTSSTAVSVTGVSIQQPNPEEYSESNTCGTQIGPGANCTISVTFAPQRQGLGNGGVQINDNGGGTQEVPLTGTGTSAGSRRKRLE